MESSADPYGTFLGELGDLSAGLTAHGIAVTWPEPFSPWKTGITGAAALALAFVYSLLRYLQRFFLFSGDDGRERTTRVSRKGALLLCAVVLVTALAVRFVPPAARIIGALAAVFVVTEASFLALDGWRRPWAGLVGSFLFAVAGGLAITAFFSEPVYMLRLRAFSGVKATLFLPPLLVLLADLRRREHPESLGEIFRRPPLWGELFLIGILLAGAGLVLFRSDNVQFVPAFEVRMREFLERILVARPRNKEIFLGYPALLLWYYVRKADLWPRYREVLRMATVLGFSSAVNSFCHFHTPLYFILFRQFNGLYHVLGGIISPMDGIGPSDLEINSLIERVREGKVEEVILALSTTMEGDTTNFFIFKKLKDFNLKISTLARGVAIGDGLEYADEITLGRSIKNRTDFESSISQ